jgi:hypothetical protein
VKISRRKFVLVVLAVLVALTLVGGGLYLSLGEGKSVDHSYVNLVGFVHSPGLPLVVNFTSSSGAVYSVPITGGVCQMVGFYGDCASYSYDYSTKLPNNDQYSVTISQDPGSPCSAGVIRVSGENDSANVSC